MIFYNNITCAETKEEIYRTRKYFKLHVLHFWYYWIHIKLYNSCCNQFHSLGFISLFENPEVALTAHVTQFNVTFSWFSYFIPSARILVCSKIFSKALLSYIQVKSISISYIYKVYFCEFLLAGSTIQKCKRTLNIDSYLVLPVKFNLLGR